MRGEGWMEGDVRNKTGVETGNGNSQKQLKHKKDQTM